MKRVTSDNAFGAKAWLLRPYKGTTADYARADNCYRQGKRWFMRVYDHFTHNGWMLRHPHSKHLGY